MQCVTDVFHQTFDVIGKVDMLDRVTLVDSMEAR